MLCVVGVAVWMDVVCCRCGYLGEWGMLCVRCRFGCFGEYMGGGVYKLSLWVFGYKCLGQCHASVGWVVQMKELHLHHTLLHSTGGYDVGMEGEIHSVHVWGTILCVYELYMHGGM